MCILKHEVSDTFEFHMIEKFMKLFVFNSIQKKPELHATRMAKGKVYTTKAKLIRRVEDNHKICEAFI